MQEHGYALEWQRRAPTIYTVLASCSCEKTKLEWVVDSDFRFFPTLPDETFGYVLHPIDLATNKVGAAYGRQEPRDAVDLLTIHERILPLGAVVWAAAGKALGFTPEGSSTKFAGMHDTRKRISAVSRAIRRLILPPQ